jgi:hypothetical protein
MFLGISSSPDDGAMSIQRQTKILDFLTDILILMNKVNVIGVRKSGIFLNHPYIFAPGKFEPPKFDTLDYFSRQELLNYGPVDVV